MSPRGAAPAHAARAALIVAAGGAMLAWSWGTWPDVQVDFGRELYVPWRLAEGERLYRDIAWFNGPLSAHWNALLFEVFGVGLRTLVFANLALVGCTLLLLDSLLTRVGDRLSATVACLVFATLFAFSQVDEIGNDNYLTPYAHEVTHGLLLSLLAIRLFEMRRSRPRAAALGSGLALGLVALTKSEIFLAAAAALGTGWLLARRQDPRVAPGPAWGRTALLFLGGAVLPVLGAFALLALAMPPAQALAGTLASFRSVLTSDVSSLYFYRTTLGTLAWRENALQLVCWSLAYGGVALAAVGGAFTLRPRDAGAERTATGGAALYLAGVFTLAVLAVLLLGDVLGASWPDVLRPLPVVTGTLAAAGLVTGWRRGLGSGTGEALDETQRRVLRSTLLVFATLLLAKVALRVRLDQYGFALAMPATLLAVTALLSWLPHWLEERGGDARTSRTVGLAAVAAVALGLLPLIGARFEARTLEVGRGPDRFLADARAPIVRAALDALAARPPDETLAVVPEGVMLNYLGRRRNPTGYVNFMPPELAIFGEDRILAAFRAQPPDLILLAHKDTAEYGVGFFGRGYARDLGRFIEADYRPAAGASQLGDVPLRRGSGFGVRLLERRAEPLELGAPHGD